MAAKRRNWNTRTILIIFIIVLIILAIIYVVFNQPADTGPNIITVQELSLKKDDWVGKTVYVEGIYSIQLGRDAFTSPTNEVIIVPESYIFLDLTNLDLDKRVNFTENSKYVVTGILEIVENPTVPGAGSEIQLVVSDYDPV